MSELTCLNILYTLREKNNCVPIKELSHIFGTHLGSYHKCDFHPLINLCNEGYIIILDNTKKDITEQICKTDYDNLYRSLYSYFYEEEEIIFVKLTDKLSKIQSLLGFSLSDTIIKFSHDFSTMAIPFFNEPNLSLQTDVFVIMPFKEEFDFLYSIYIKRVCDRLKISCKRADDLYSSNPIMQDIWSLIYNSKVIIADCSTKNPNVMYELGIAHALGKKVILITQDVNDIPFDLRHLRHLHYKYTPHSIEIFEDDLEYALSPLFE